jgi:hypothetical protein
MLRFFPVPLSQRLPSCATKVLKKLSMLLQLMLASLFYAVLISSYIGIKMAPLVVPGSHDYFRFRPPLAEMRQPPWRQTSFKGWFS